MGQCVAFAGPKTRTGWNSFTDKLRHLDETWKCMLAWH